jgi:hypothetical protein
VFTRLAELSVHGANVQEGQIVLVAAEIGLEEQARATAAAAYKLGAKFVDVAYFDPYLKRVRIESADPDTLDFVPQWYGERVLEHAEQNGARILLRGVTAPNAMDGLDKSLLGKDMLPSVKETLKVIDDDEASNHWTSSTAIRIGPRPLPDNNTRKPRSRAPVTAASQRVDFPIPASPSSTNPAGPSTGPSRNAYTEPSSWSRPTTSLNIMLGTIAERDRSNIAIRCSTGCR